jgi:hypothetical protein
MQVSIAVTYNCVWRHSVRISTLVDPCFRLFWQIFRDFSDVSPSECRNGALKSDATAPSKFYQLLIIFTAHLTALYNVIQRALLNNNYNSSGLYQAEEVYKPGV